MSQPIKKMSLFIFLLNQSKNEAVNRAFCLRTAIRGVSRRFHPLPQQRAGGNPAGVKFRWRRSVSGFGLPLPQDAGAGFQRLKQGGGRLVPALVAPVKFDME